MLAYVQRDRDTRRETRKRKEKNRIEHSATLASPTFGPKEEMSEMQLLAVSRQRESYQECRRRRTFKGKSLAVVVPSIGGKRGRMLNQSFLVCYSRRNNDRLSL